MREHIRHDVDKKTLHTVEWKIKGKDEKPTTVVESKWYMTQKSPHFPAIKDLSFEGNKTLVEITGGLSSCECPLVNEVKDSDGMVYKMEYLVNTFKAKVAGAEQPTTVSTTVSK